MATFCLIHGNWHDGSCWAPVVDLLRARGHDAVAPDLPFDDPEAGYEESVRPVLRALDGVADPIIVVGHSRGSAEAALVGARRHPAMVVYVCPRFGSFPTPREAPSVFREGFAFPAKDALGRTVWDADAAISAMYPRLPRDTARDLAQRLQPGAATAGGYPLTEHPHVPVALIYATDDELFTPAWERFVAHEMLGVEPIESPGGHFPMAEDPAALAELLDRLASEATESPDPA